MVKLSDTISLDPALIEKAVFRKAGSKIKARLASAPSSATEDLTTPIDEVLIHSKDESVVAVRGAEAASAWALLQKLRNDENLSFEMTGGE